ncbi:MAG: hypothetical protein JW786_07090 [Desulfobacterales bacterium]|nr:hypothetical protein [Desulfobacterales bacterium]
MPRGDRTGPKGQGPETGRKMGGREQGGRGRRGGYGKGPEGFCVCPNCGEKSTHEIGRPCYEQKCPKCGTAMIRE